MRLTYISGCGIVYMLLSTILFGSFQTQAAEEVTILAAGDIAVCYTDNDEATAKLLDTLPGTVLALGDNVYSSGTAAEYANCYGPTWGRHRDRTRPIPGNHDYVTSGASAYYSYFGSRAGEPTKGYYSYNLGSWHIIALNSEISMSVGSAQERWLRADLAAHPTACTLAYIHKPLVSSGRYNNSTSVKPIWNALYQYDVDVILTGHEHHYERLAQLNPNGSADPGRGIRQFIVGTGGTGLRSLETIHPASEARNATVHGILKLSLGDGAYQWEFVPIAGKTYIDHGSDTCVTSAVSGTSTPDSLTASPVASETAVVTSSPSQTDTPIFPTEILTATSVPSTATPTPTLIPTQTPTPTPAGQSVTSLSLINADTNAVIGPLTDGMTIDFSTLGTRNLSVQAHTSPSKVGSVRFSLDGSAVRLENVAPYAIAGDGSSGTDYYAWTPSIGTHTLKVTPYSALSGGGTVGTALTVGFTVSE